MDIWSAVRSRDLWPVVREEYGRYIKRRGVGQGKAQRRVIEEVVWGILLSESLRLSRIARWIQDGAQRLLSRIKRLSRQLRTSWDDEQMRRQHVSALAHVVGEESSIVVDLTDVRKAEGRSFEHLGKVYDGSQGETAWGYWVLAVTAVLGKGRQVPLYLAPYSAQAPEFDSENGEVKRAVETVVAAVRTQGIWVWDRGFDNRWLFHTLAEQQLRFLVCAYRERTVLWRGRRQSVHTVVESVPLNAYVHIGRRGHKKRSYDVHFGATEISLPSWDEAHGRHRGEQHLWLLVVQGYDPKGERTFFYTNVAVDTIDTQRVMVRRYADRWAIEETIEFLKQRFAMEDVRVRTLRAIGRLLHLAMLAFAFLAWVLLRFERRHKKLLPVLCSTQAELDPDAHFLYYRFQEAIQLAASFWVALDMCFKTG